MDILNVLKQLRDDLKSWVTNNLNALNAKIDEKTIPIDNKLDETSTNPVQNKVISEAINNIPRFSGDYNDLINAPNITENEAENVVIADGEGNIIFKVDADGTHTTALTLNGEKAATETYVDQAIAEIPEVDLTNYYTKDETNTALENLQTEISESIVSESDEWKVVDEAGNIMFSVDESGAHTAALTINGEAAATEAYVDSAIANIDIPEVNLDGYATEQWVEDKNYLTEHQDISGKSDVGHKHVIADITGLPDYATKDYVATSIADLVNSAPEALDTLGELAAALENHEDAYDALLETVGNKATYADLEDMKAELSESIVAETDEFHIVDDAGNIVASIDANGVATTVVTAQSVVINGANVAEHMDDTTIHVTATEKAAWNNKSNFSGSYNDLSDKPALFSGSYNDLTDKPEAADLSNYYTKSEVDTAIENVEVDLTGYATEEYVGNAINAIDFPETDLSDYYNKSETDAAIGTAKEELSESIESESESWQVVDNAGNIIFSVDAQGVNTADILLDGISVLELIDNAGGSNGVTSWNDLEDRPFGEKYDILFDQKVEATGNDEGKTYYLSSQYLEAIEGKKYIVEFNGNRYELEMVYDPRPEIFSLGVTKSEFNNYGEDVSNAPLPFLIATESDGDRIYVYAYEAGTYDLKIMCMPIIKHLDSKYIKDMYYETEPVETVLVDGSFEVPDDDNYVQISNQLYFEVGKTYHVTFNGENYECVAWDNGDDSILIGNGEIYGGNGGNGEPFSCDSYDEGVCYINVTESGVYELKIVATQSEIIKIDKKYLPNLVGESTTGKTYIIDNEEYIAEEGAEVFNLDNIAVGYASHAEGDRTKAVGYTSHAEGVVTKAFGDGSHAEGYNTRTFGTYSHAEGCDTIASGENQHVQGKHNIEDTDGVYAHIVGNGQGVYARSNAHTLDWSGNAEFAGDVKANACGGTTPISLVELYNTIQTMQTTITELQNKIATLEANQAAVEAGLDEVLGV